jgi:thiol-disulfide isomerase/thioredoxin
MNHSRFTVALATAAAVLVGGCGNGEQPANPGPAIEATAKTVVPNEPVVFELADMSGTLRHSSEWDGKPKLLNFWATWCAPCRREIPLLKQAQDDYTDLGLQVIGIAVDFNDDVVAYAEEAQFNYPILVGQEDAMSVAESSGIDFIGLPFTMVLSPSGELIKTHIGEIVEEHIEQIATVLAQMERGELDLASARAQLAGL